MNNQSIISKEVNIYVYPEKDESNPSPPGSIVTIGDLHANAIKFMYMLIERGVVTGVSKEDYEELVKLYKDYSSKAHTLTKGIDNKDKSLVEFYKNSFLQYLNEFKAIIDKIQVNTDLSVRLIGDELADRGANDIFVLWILDKLHKSNLKLDILISNHGSAVFNTGYYADCCLDNIGIERGFCTSLENLNTLIKAQIVDISDVQKIVRTAYEPKVKALAYAISSNGKEISIFSHAPVCVHIIEGVAQQLAVAYADETALDLTFTIDRINDAFQKKLKEKQLSTLIEFDERKQPSSPISRIIWNRNEDVILKNNIKSYVIYNVHGHTDDLKDINRNGQINLDNTLGKYVDQPTGKYKLHVCKCYKEKLLLSRKKEKLTRLTSRLEMMQSDNRNKEHQEAAKKLLDVITNNNNEYEAKVDNVNGLISQLETALKTLQKNRNFMPKVINLLAHIVMFILIVPAIYIKFNYGQFYGKCNVIETQSSKLIKDLKKTLESMQAYSSNSPNNDTSTNPKI